MTLLFPIGTMVANSGNGTINNVSYPMFEPNDGCKSTMVFYNNTTVFQQQTLLTRKKALPTIQIIYEYNNIFSSEYNQVEDFIYSTQDNLVSFYVVDFSQGANPATVSSDFNLTISNTRLFSKVSNQKAHYIFFSNGSNWKFAEVTHIDANTSITTDVSATNQTSKYGDLNSTQVQQSDVLVYPVYECYTTGGSLDNFKSSEYINDSTYRGFVYTGNITFMSKYKI